MHQPPPHEEAFGAREIKRMTIEIDNRIHEIIEDYARRGMEYDGFRGFD